MTSRVPSPGLLCARDTDTPAAATFRASTPRRRAAIAGTSRHALDGSLKQNKSLLLMEAPHRSPAASGGEDPSPAAAESSSSSGQEGESQWLATLSEPELDVLISLKKLAMMRAKTAGHPDLGNLFDLRTLRALGVVLLENLKERLKETSVNPNILDKLALLSDPDAEFTNNGSDSEVVKPNKDQSTPNSVNKKRAHMQDGCHEEVAESHKKRKMSEKM